MVRTLSPLVSDSSANSSPASTSLGAKAVGPARDSKVERQQRRAIREKDVLIEGLRERIRRLEQSERRLRARAAEQRDTLANKAAENGEIMRALQVAEEALDEKEGKMRALVQEVHHYQGWWLNEYYCLKVALKLARNQKDAGVQAMRESSHARFMKWSASHQA